jgi:hypothetical protein
MVIGRSAQNLRRVRAKGRCARNHALKNRPLDPMTGQMTQPINAVAATTPAATTGGTAPATTATSAAAAKTTTSFAGELASATKAAPRPDGEQTKKIAGHPYARIENGDDKGKYLNQVTGNPRQGSAFRLVERAGHVFHVYGTGADKVIIGLKTPDAAQKS